MTAMKPVTIEEDLGAILLRVVADACSSESEARTLMTRFRTPLLATVLGGLPDIIGPLIQSIRDVTYVTVGTSRVIGHIIDQYNSAPGVPMVDAGMYALTFERVMNTDDLVTGQLWIDRARRLGAIAHLDHALSLVSVPGKIGLFRDKLREKCRNLVFIGDHATVGGRLMYPYIDLWDDGHPAEQIDDDGVTHYARPVKWGYFDAQSALHDASSLAVRAVLVPGPASE